MTKRFFTSRYAVALTKVLPVLVLGAASGLLLLACSGGGGGGVEGAATIRGSVASFEGDQAFFLRTPRPALWARAAQAAGDLLIPPAYAGVGGVQVKVRGTDLVATTADDGLFVISGVPPGDQVLEFSLNAATAELALNVPKNSSIDLGDVKVRGGKATPSRVDVEIFEEDNSGPGGNDNGTDLENHNGEDNRNDNENSVEDHNGNDDGNDNGDDHGGDNGNDNGDDHGGDNGDDHGGDGGDNSGPG